tara:strand:+ start:627 stop:899 length:273 start_codon:yes stop_codon:yes gene_type:complete
MPELSLFKAVLLQGLTDALGKFEVYSRLNAKYEVEAKEWLKSKDFILICSYANWQPSEIKKMYSDISKHKHYLTTTDIRYLLNERLARRY